MEQKFAECTSLKEILSLVFKLSGDCDSVLLNRFAAKRLDELGYVDEAIRFYLLSEEQNNISALKDSVKEIKDTAVFILNVAYENKEALSIFLSTSEKNMKAAKIIEESSKNIGIAAALMSGPMGSCNN